MSRASRRQHAPNQVDPNRPGTAAWRQNENANTQPQHGSIEIGLLKPGSPDSMTVGGLVRTPVCAGSAFVHGEAGVSFGERAFDGFIDARVESTNGTDVDLGQPQPTSTYGRRPLRARFLQFDGSCSEYISRRVSFMDRRSCSEVYRDERSSDDRAGPREGRRDGAPDRANDPTVSDRPRPQSSVRDWCPGALC